MKSRIYLSPPHSCGFEHAIIDEAFRTNCIGQYGPNVTAFESELQQYTGSPFAAALSSGTAAIHLALILSDVKPGDLVICQSFTFSATANPIAYLGAKPVFVDSEPNTWNMDPELMEITIQACLSGSVTGKPQSPKAILAVDLYGMPAKMGQITAIADKYGIPVIEDAAEALGSEIDGKKCGTLGRMGILSFNGNKIITTGGGGALLSDDETLIEKARFLATQARDKAPHYQHSQIGYNYRMSNIVAGIGRGQLKVIDERIVTRRANFERYKQYFESLEAKGYHIGFQGEKLSAVSSQLSAENKEQRTPRPGSGTTKNKEHIPEPRTRPDLSGIQNSEHYFSNRWLTTIIIDPSKNKGLTREDLRLAFEADNIESRPLWKPMHLQPVFADCPFFSSQLSAISFQLTSGFRNQESGIRNKMPSLSGQLFNHGLCLPSGSNLTEKEWGRIFSMLDTVFK